MNTKLVIESASNCPGCNRSPDAQFAEWFRQGGGLYLHFVMTPDGPDWVRCPATQSTQGRRILMENPQPPHTNQAFGRQAIPAETRMGTAVVLRREAREHERKAVALHRLAGLVDGSMDATLSYEVRKLLDEALYDLVR